MSLKTVEPEYRLFGARVVEARGRKGIRQQELADLTGMSRGSIANIEIGRQRFMLHNIRTFAKALGVSPKWLTKGIWI